MARRDLLTKNTADCQILHGQCVRRRQRTDRFPIGFKRTECVLAERVESPVATDCEGLMRCSARECDVGAPCFRGLAEGAHDSVGTHPEDRTAGPHGHAGRHPVAAERTPFAAECVEAATVHNQPVASHAEVSFAPVRNTAAARKRDVLPALQSRIIRAHMNLSAARIVVVIEHM